MSEQYKDRTEQNKQNARNGHYTSENVGIRHNRKTGQREFFDTETGKAIEGRDKSHSDGGHRVYNVDEHIQRDSTRPQKFLFVRSTVIPELTEEQRAEIEAIGRRQREQQRQEQEERDRAIREQEGVHQKDDSKGHATKGKEKDNKEGRIAAKDTVKSESTDDKITINVTSKGLATALKELGVKNYTEKAYKLLEATGTSEYNTPKEFRVSEEVLGEIAPQALEKLKKANQAAER